MDDRGYTLVEVLAALMIISLALGGMFAAVRVIGQLQQRGADQTAASEHLNALANGLGQLMRDQGPFSSAGGVHLVGSRAGFQFDCATAPACSANIRTRKDRWLLEVHEGSRLSSISLPSRSAPEFEYIGSRTVSDHWPPDNPTDWQALRAIALGNGPNAPPLMVTRLWIEGASARPPAGAAP